MMKNLVPFNRNLKDTCIMWFVADFLAGTIQVTTETVTSSYG